MDSEPDGLEGRAAMDQVSAAMMMRTARERAGLSIADVATKTRVPLRHLQALELGDYAALPGVTYCAGFSRAFARAVGMDEVALVAKVREEIEASDDVGGVQREFDEPADPARIPTRALAWIAALIAILVVGGYAIWRMQINVPPSEAPAVVATKPVAPVKRPAPAPQTQPVTGPVVMTAAEDVWLRIYDASDKTLILQTLKKGESLTVPADANDPRIITGRADALAITVGGRAVPPLGDGKRTISGVPVSAAALLGRTTENGDGDGAALTQPAPATVPGPTAGGSAAPATERPVGTKPAQHSSSGRATPSKPESVPSKPKPAAPEAGSGSEPPAAPSPTQPAAPAPSGTGTVG